jgi:hypothetical protein
MSRPRKHKFRSLQVGESYVMTDPPTWMKPAIYSYGASSGKTFSICKAHPFTKDRTYMVLRTK